MVIFGSVDTSFNNRDAFTISIVWVELNGKHGAKFCRVEFRATGVELVSFVRVVFSSISVVLPFSKIVVF